MRVSLSILILFSFCSCNSQRLFNGYNLSKNYNLSKLKKELNEISGLEYINKRTIVSIQDEDGILYYINPKTGKIKKEIQFGKHGDHEGIAKAGNEFYILLSNGTLIQLLKNGETKKYKFKHSKNMDFEGLCYDNKNDRLLVACKENLSKGKKKQVFIYAFKLAEKEYKKKPLFHINKNKVHKNFKPSAIAIHPNGNLYILSSFSKSLLVLNPDGKILDKTQLNDIIFHQPEGITFGPKGTMYISNEKHKTYPTLLIFKPNNNE